MCAETFPDIKTKLQGKKFFTILELLVVISIIVLLASLILPALKNAKEKGKQSVCANNLRQCGIAVHSYAGDYNSFLPPARTTITGGSLNHNIWWPDFLIPYLTQKELFYGYPAGQYRWRQNPFDCPATTMPSTAYGVYTSYMTTTGGFTPRYSAYTTNALYTAKKFNLSGKTALLFDSPLDTWGGACGYATTTSAEGGTYWYANIWLGKIRRHSPGINWLFADGRVLWRKWDPTNSSGADAEFNPDWALLK